MCHNVEADDERGCWTTLTSTSREGDTDHVNAKWVKSCTERAAAAFIILLPRATVVDSSLDDFNLGRGKSPCLETAYNTHSALSLLNNSSYAST